MSTARQLVASVRTVLVSGNGPAETNVGEMLVNADLLSNLNSVSNGIFSSSANSNGLVCLDTQSHVDQLSLDGEVKPPALECRSEVSQRKCNGCPAEPATGDRRELCDGAGSSFQLTSSNAANVDQDFLAPSK